LRMRLAAGASLSVEGMHMAPDASAETTSP